MKTIFMCACRALILVVVGVKISFAQTDPTLKTLTDAYWEARMERFPTAATALGDYRYNDRLEDVSYEAEERYRANITDLLIRAGELDADQLSPEDQFTRALFRRALRDDLLKLDCWGRFLPLNPLEGPHIRLPLLLVSQPFRHAKDYQDYATRLRAFRRQTEDYIKNMRAGISRGIVPPCVIINKVIPQIETHIVQDVTKSELFKPLQKMNELSDADQKNIRAQITRAITSDVIPAYRSWLRFVRDEYLPACRDTAGIGAIRGGDKIYQKLVYWYTTVRFKSDEIHEIGLSEVKRIRGEMAKIQKEVGFTGSLDEFLSDMRSNPRHRFQTREELYNAADTILNRTKPLMKKLFNRLPEANCVMKEMESFRAASSPVAYYNPSPEDASRPGYFYINTHAPKERLRFTLEALTYHESVPGHHLQMALDQENRDLPRFRRYGSFTAYVEGWALYSEKLGYEVGGYQDAYSRFGQLTFEMWRACRLVVDTGMHSKGWTRQQAIDFMMNNTSLAPIDIEAEIDRYISWPGQALAYKIGELRIVQLRREAEQRLGSRFDLRAFHDTLLAGGAMPIDMLEKRMHEWMNSQ